MQRINRTVAIIKPRQPFVDWLNSLPDDDHVYTLEELAADNLTFLIPEADSHEGAMDYIRKKHDLIFTWELWGWVTAEELWPAKRDRKVFREWFEIEINSEVFDLVDGAVAKEDV
jgi:hypothetical protein